MLSKRIWKKVLFKRADRVGDSRLVRHPNEAFQRCVLTPSFRPEPGKYGFDDGEVSTRLRQGVRIGYNYPHPLHHPRRRMSESPQTRATLLLRMRDREDGDAWSEFLRDYGPMIYRFVRSRGLQDADASDLVQDVMRSVGMAISGLDYQKEKGGFRAWLFTITRNKLSTYYGKRQRIGPVGNRTDQYEMLSQAGETSNELDQQWELEHQRQLAALAMEALKPTLEPKTWAAFEMTAIEGISAEDAGEKLGLSKGAVYVARSRVTAKLRGEIERMLAEEDQ